MTIWLHETNTYAEDLCPTVPCYAPLQKTQGVAGVFNEIFLFVKMYDPVQEKLTYVGRFYCPKHAKLNVSELPMHVRFPVGCLLMSQRGTLPHKLHMDFPMYMASRSVALRVPTSVEPRQECDLSLLDLSVYACVTASTSCGSWIYA